MEECKELGCHESSFAAKLCKPHYTDAMRETKQREVFVL